MNEHKGLILLFFALFFSGCEPEETGGGTFDYVEHYILINPGNLFINSAGELILNYSQNSYEITYDFSCIDEKDTAKFNLSETGKFSDTYMKVKTGTSADDHGYYFSGNISFTPSLNSPWGCSYKLNDSIGFTSVFFNPSPHLITNIPVYNKKIIIHTKDTEPGGSTKPRIEIVQIENGKCDTIQLFWL